MAALYIDSLADDRLTDYRDVRDKDLLRERDLFLVEGRENVRCLIHESPFEPKSLLLSKPAFEAMSETLQAVPAGVSILVGSRDVVSRVAGFDFHSGCLAAVTRAEMADSESLLSASAERSVVVVLEGLTNPDNVGGVFRNARALGVDAVFLCPSCCDPLYRKAIRVSMGAALCVPTVRFASWPAGLTQLRDASYRVVALDPREPATPIGTPEWVERARGFERVALVLGTEGAGISSEALALCDERHRVAMSPGIDSLNVATACAVALHHLFLARND